VELTSNQFRSQNFLAFGTRKKAAQVTALALGFLQRLEAAGRAYAEARGWDLHNTGRASFHTSSSNNLIDRFRYIASHAER